MIDERPVIIAEDVNGLEIDRFKFPIGRVDMFRFTQVSNLTIEHAPALDRALIKHKIDIRSSS